MKYICSICGYVYEEEDFTLEPEDYVCPLCDAGKEAFEKRDVDLEIQLATNEINQSEGA
ncbi:MAG: rubredoxin/rubrerythrin [Erysipelotrichia bacterium]|nr:rubredoxin/rubrerythrin [Erysipelotrichia bacterium]NCC55291.1 rubredoxin/rubrerythrin [Erysipelotrichia bacterium]